MGFVLFSSQITELAKETDEMKANEQQLIARLNLRKKQFHALMTSIHQLKSVLDEGILRK